MDHHHLRSLLVATVLVVAVAGGATLGVVPVAAQDSSDSNPLDGLAAQGEDSDATEAENESAVRRILETASSGKDYAAKAAAGFEGSADRFLTGTLSNPFSDDPTNAEHATACQRAVEANADTLVDGLNAHTDPGQGWNTTQVVFTGAEGDDAAVYFLTDLDENATEIVDVRAVDQTNRTADHTVVIESLAARDCDELVVDAADAFRSGSEPLDEIDQAKLAGKYCSKTRALVSRDPGSACDVTATYWMEESELPEYDLGESSSE